MLLGQKICSAIHYFWNHIGREKAIQICSQKWENSISRPVLLQYSFIEKMNSNIVSNIFTREEEIQMAKNTWKNVLHPWP
jgi:hypothetical protein